VQARAAGFDQIGSELLRALDACRPQCLSLHDAEGDVLWLNAGVIGPDEHGYILDALDELALEPERTHMQRRLADNRRALFMGARDPAGNCSGIVFAILDSPGGPEDHLPLPARLAALMRRFSRQLAPPPSKLSTKGDLPAMPGASTDSQPLAIEVTELELEPLAGPSHTTSDHRAPTPAAAPSNLRLADVEVTELELAPDELPLKPVQPKPEQKSAASEKPPLAKAEPKPAQTKPDAKPVASEGSAQTKPVQKSLASEKPAVAKPEPKHAASDKPAHSKPAPKPMVAEQPVASTEANAVTIVAPIAVRAPNLSISQSTGQNLPIRARKFVRLQGRGSNRRYQIATIPAAEGQDIRILQAVCEWLSLNLGQYSEENASFTVPISTAAALDGRFVSALGGALTQRSLPEGMVGLLLPSAAWRHPGTAPLLAQCERLRCPVTLDDFNLRHDGFQILRSKAIRMVKIDPQLTGPAMNDRFARAALAAITQSARVLGLHCTAKGEISSSGARWLAAAGIDYADPATADAASAPAPKAAERRSRVQAS
jgi:hypothetical protein